MVSFVFLDEKQSWIPNIGASAVLPDVVASMEITGPFDSKKGSYKSLIRMLQGSHKQLQRITMTDFLEKNDSSPEFLAFLVLVCNKAKALELHQCSLSTHAMACLMATLIARDGVRDLSFHWNEDDAGMDRDQANLLFQGIASSPCLERLDVAIDFADDDGRKSLLQGLRRNKSLKDISLWALTLSDEDDPTFLPTLVKAMILGPNVESVSIIDTGSALQLDALHDILCHPDCSLESLNLGSVAISAEDWWNDSVIQNTSVKSLSFKCVNSSNDNLKKIISVFKSVEELDIKATRITELSFLDPLLFGERSQLISLDVSDNDINREEMERFTEKLRKIRGLKHLAVGDRSYGYSEESVNTALVNALRDNTDLEHVNFARNDLPLDLNRGGRRIFESKKQFPRNLLPRVLERASKISYYKHHDLFRHPTNNEARADVVFWMMQRIVPDL